MWIKCSKCNKHKALYMFHKSKKGVFGISTCCNKCKAETDKEYRLKNTDKVRNKKAEWVARNTEHVKAKKRKDYINNREKVRARVKKWKSENKEILYEIKAKRRAKKFSNEIDGNDKLLIRDLYKLRDILSRDFRGFHVDHIIPISKGGAHSASNLQIVTMEHNLSKGNSCTNVRISGITKEDLLMHKDLFDAIINSK